MAAAIGNAVFDNTRPVAFIAGPCMIEEETVWETARALAELAKSRKVAVVFKASYDKANRQSFGSARGVGIERGLALLGEIKRELQLPILTDVHHPEECEAAAAVADCLQIPAFLCRQTDLVAAAARTGRAVNIKKGQFLSPYQIESIVEKARQFGAKDVLVTERGVSFGYHDLVFDPRSIEVMKTCAPVIFDASHSVQRPGSEGGTSGGDRKFIPALASAAAAVGVAGIFIETHPAPSKALSDRETQWPLADLLPLVDRIIEIDRVVKKRADAHR